LRKLSYRKWKGSHLCLIKKSTKSFKENWPVKMELTERVEFSLALTILFWLIILRYMVFENAIVILPSFMEFWLCHGFQIFGLSSRYCIQFTHSFWHIYCLCLDDKINVHFIALGLWQFICQRLSLWTQFYAPRCRVISIIN